MPAKPDQYILVQRDSLERGGRRDLAFVAGLFLTGIPLVSGVIAVATQDFGLSDVTDAPPWVYTVDAAIVRAACIAALAAVIMLLFRSLRPFALGMIIGIAAATVFAVVAVLS